MMIAFVGAYLVEGAVDVRDKLLEALAEKQSVELSFAGVEQVDMSFFYAIHSAVKTFKAAGGDLQLKADIPSAIGQEAELAGFGHLVTAE